MKLEGMLKMNLSDYEKRKVELALNMFPEVQWDRWTGTKNYFAVYGWIPREDNRSDFLVLFFEECDLSGSVTSSAKYSEIFSKRMGLNHSGCNRVEHLFSNTNHIKLEHESNNDYNTN